VTVHDVHEDGHVAPDVLVVLRGMVDEASFHFDVEVTLLENFDSFDFELVAKHEAEDLD
jgi:hypothetical protein